MDKFIRRIVDAFLQGVEDVMGCFVRGMSAPEAEMMIKERCDSLAVRHVFGVPGRKWIGRWRKDLEGRKRLVVNRRSRQPFNLEHHGKRPNMNELTTTTRG